MHKTSFNIILPLEKVQLENFFFLCFLVCIYLLSFTIILGIVFNDVYSMYWLSRLLIQRGTGQETEYLVDLFETSDHPINLLSTKKRNQIS